MLILNRNKNESVVINENVVVTVVEIRGDRVRLGFEAPKDITIHRQEIHEIIQHEKEEKSKNSNKDAG